MKKLIYSLLLLSLIPVGFAALGDGKPIITWVNATQRVDGTPIVAGDIVSTIVSWSYTPGGTYSNSVTVPFPGNSVQITATRAGNHCFVIFHRGPNGDSAASSEVCGNVTFPAPKSPTGLTVQ